MEMPSGNAQSAILCKDHRHPTAYRQPQAARQSTYQVRTSFTSRFARSEHSVLAQSAVVTVPCCRAHPAVRPFDPLEVVMPEARIILVHGVLQKTVRGVDPL